MLIALNFAEAGSRFDGTGGAYLFTRAAFGRFTSFEVGWMLWITRATSWASVINGLATVLAYLWPLAIVPLVVEKQDAEVQWHARHGLVLMAAELVLLFAVSVLTGMASMAMLGLGCALSLFAVLLWTALVLLHIIAILKGLAGGRLIIPGVSAYADRF